MVQNPPRPTTTVVKGSGVKMWRGGWDWALQGLPIIKGKRPLCIYIHTYDILRVGLQIQPVKLNRRGGLKKRLERKYDYRKTKEARGRFGGPFRGDGGRVKVGPRPKQNTPLRKLFFKQSITK